MLVTVSRESLEVVVTVRRFTALLSAHLRERVPAQSILRDRVGDALGVQQECLVRQVINGVALQIY
jgi:hypothetical protein